MEQNQLPERWQGKLKTYLSERHGTAGSRPLATDFRYSLKINFADGSFAYFQYAFYLLDREAGEVAVLTEHCGYHVFPLGGTHLELLESRHTDVGTS